MTRRLARPALAALALLVLLAGCGPDAPAPARSRVGTYDGSGRLLEGERDRVEAPNIVLLVLDTTRADGLEDAGGRPPALAAMRAFADRATRFVDASTAASWTAPSVTSILTGLQPTDHGVQGRFQASPLVPAVATLAEYLQAAGYQTGAFTGGGWVSEEMGLAQGFDHFHPSWDLQDPQEAVVRWVRAANRSRPVFLFLHTYEAHDPYGPKNPPEGHDDPARVAEAKDVVRRLAERVGDRETPFVDSLDASFQRELFLLWRGDPLRRQAVHARFGRDRIADAVIRYTVEGLPREPDRARLIDGLHERYRHGLEVMDAHFAQFLPRLDAAGLPGRTVFILCSDHGEAFGEHDIVGHGRWLWDVLTRAILVVRAPGRLDPGVVRGSCGVIDIVPTVLDLAGLPPPRGISGRSVLPLARGREPGHPVRAEEYRTEYGAQGVTDGTTVRTVSVRSERAKWLATWDPKTQTTREQWFDLRADPGESNPLGTVDPGTFGPEFAAEVERARALIASFPGRADNEGTGRFSGGE